MSIGFHTYNPDTLTHNLEFNPLDPVKNIEKTFESVELSLNILGYIPYLSFYTGSIRLIGGISLVIVGIFNAVIDAKNIIEHDRACSSPMRKSSRSVSFLGVSADLPTSFLKRIQLYLKSIAEIFKLTPHNEEESIESLEYHNNKIKHLDWVCHGIANIVRSFVEISFPVGIGNISLFTYDNFKKYRYEYLHTSYGNELSYDERYG
jgi:hypothetical protein